MIVRIEDPWVIDNVLTTVGPKASRQRPRGGRRAGARPIGGCLTASDYSMTPPQVPPTTVLRRARPEPPAASGKVHARDDQRDTNMATKSNPARGARHQEWLEPLEACRAQSLRLKAYAEQAGLEVQRLYHWRWRLKAHGLRADTCQ